MPLNAWQTRFMAVTAFLAGFAIPVSTALENITVGLLVLTFLLAPSLWREVPKVLRQPFVFACLILYLVLLLGTTYSSVGFPGAVKMLLKMREYLLVPLLFVLCLQVPIRRALLLGFATGALLSVLVSVGIAILGADTLLKINSLFAHPVLQAVPEARDWTAFRTHIAHNFFASLLVLGLLIVLLTRECPQKWRIQAWVAVAVCLLDILFLVKGRTSQFSLLLLIGLVLWLWNRRIGLVLALGVLLIVPPVMYLSSSAIRDGLHSIESDVSQFRQGKVDTSVGLRLDFYRNSMALIAEKPLLGHGTGSFSSEYRRLTGHTAGDVAAQNPHNDYLWFGVEQGVLGVMALLGIMGAALFDARRRAPSERWMVIALVLAMALGSLANSFFIDSGTRIGFVLLACALLAGNSIGAKRKASAIPV